jgi:hypothetical protein
MDNPTWKDLRQVPTDIPSHDDLLDVVKQAILASGDEDLPDIEGIRFADQTTDQELIEMIDEVVFRLWGIEWCMCTAETELADFPEDTNPEETYDRIKTIFGADVRPLTKMYEVAREILNHRKRIQQTSK